MLVACGSSGCLADARVPGGLLIFGKWEGFCLGSSVSCVFTRYLLLLREMGDTESLTGSWLQIATLASSPMDICKSTK